MTLEYSLWVLTSASPKLSAPLVLKGEQYPHSIQKPLSHGLRDLGA